MLKSTKITALLLVAMLIGLASCEDMPYGDDTGLGEIPGEMQLMLTDLNEVDELEISEASLEEEFDIPFMYASEESDEACSEKPMIRGKKRGDREGRHHPLGRIFKEMELTEDQQAQVKAFMEENKECAGGLFSELRANSRTYKEEANLLRKPIIESVKAGELSKEEAKASLELIREDIRSEMSTDEDRQAIIAAIKACREELLNKISSILDEEQLAKWEEFLSKMADRQP